MARDDQIRRGLEILMLLERRHRVTKRELAIELNVHPKTIGRYLGIIGELGFPLVRERDGKQLRWGFDVGFRLVKDTPFTLEEVVALQMCGELLRPLEGSWVGEAARSGLERIRERVAEEARSQVDALKSAVTARIFGGRHYGPKNAILRVLVDSIERRARLRMSYLSRSSRRLTPRKVDPYVLFMQDGTLYLAARDERRGEVRTFAVHRIQGLERDGLHFEAPRFNLDDYLGASFRLWRGDGKHQVKVHLSPQLAAFEADRQWHPSQKRRDLPGGAVELTFELSATEEIQQWLLGFGGEAVAVHPRELVQAMAAAGRKIVERHTKAGPLSKQGPPAAAGSTGRTPRRRDRRHPQDPSE